MSSSPLRPGAGLTEQLEWYKTQYAQLESDLADFQASSKDLEEQLEKDVEAAEKNERKGREQVEKLNFEVDEWKSKHKQAKDEANRAQNALQKEITSMREENRSLQLRLRDTEVMNDDYERQARNTESSLEDVESKYNSAIERGVLLEETVRQGEQEREGLRVETQRLRDELGDLRVESEITLEKLRLAQSTEDLRASKPSSLTVGHLRTRSPASEASGITPLSPTPSTPPPKSDTASDVPTPPSPPLSDAPGNAEQKTPIPAKRRSLIPDARQTPRAIGLRGIPRHSRGPSLASNANTAVSDWKSMKAPSQPRTRSSNVPERLPRSDSLYQIRGLIGRMQKIEERVHSARSKLPAPGTPRGSPRAGSALGDNIPSSVTVRRSSKRVSSSRTSSILPKDEGAESSASSISGRRASHIKRLSYSIPRPTSAMTSGSEIPDRPPSAIDRPPSSAAIRPSSRASQVDSRPPSRSGARTELGHYASSTSALTGTSGVPSRPRSSMGGSHSPSLHRTKGSISEVRRKEVDRYDPAVANTPTRRTSGIPSAPAPSPFSKSVGPGARPRTVTVTSRNGGKASPSKDHSDSTGDMRPPPRRKQTSDIGETY